MVVEIAHGTNQEHFEPLTYRVGSSAEGYTALVSCGNGHIASLSQHMIDAAGVVTPSLDCPTKDCGWHEHVRLLDWPPPRPVKPERPGAGGLV